jgi:hypothetical protein
MKRLFTLILILFYFAEVKGQILWERMENNTNTLQDTYHKVLVKDSLIFLGGKVGLPASNQYSVFYSCYNLNGKLKWKKTFTRTSYNYDTDDFIIDTDSLLCVLSLDRNTHKYHLQNFKMLTGDTLARKVIHFPFGLSSMPYNIRGLLIKNSNNSYTTSWDGIGPTFTTVNSSGVPFFAKMTNWTTINPPIDYSNQFGFLRKSNGNLITGVHTTKLLNNIKISHPILIELNSAFDTIRSRTFTLDLPQRNEVAINSNLIQTINGDYIFTGRIDTVINSGGNIGSKHFVARTDALFNLKWIYYNDASLVDFYMTKVYELADGGVTVLANHNVNSNFAIIRINKNGKKLSHYIYSNVFCNGLLTLRDWKILADGTAIVTGKCKNGYTYLARIGSVGTPAVLGGNEGFYEKSKFSIKAYPNPATSTVSLTYNLPETVKKAELKFYVIATGKVVKNLQIKVADKLMEISVADLSSGMYAYTLFADGVPVLTQKLAVVK